MDNGSFFVVNENSSLVNKQVQFCYTEVLGCNKVPKFPVYISFSQDKVNFYFNGIIKIQKTFELRETLLFSLHIHNDKITHNELAKVLVEAENKKFPTANNEEISTRNNEKSKIKNSFYNTYYNDPKDLTKINSRKLNYKKLILDFLFDLTHSDIFHTCPYFGNLQHLLKNATFIQAINKKANFKYYRETSFTEAKEIKNRNTINNFEYKIFVDEFNKAQKEWFDLLKEKNINKVVYEDNKWFSDVETEMNSLFTDTNSIIKEFKDKEKAKNSFSDNLVSFKEKSDELRNEATEWFLERNNIIHAWFVKKGLRVVFFILAIMVLYLVFSIVNKAFNLPQFTCYINLNKEIALYITVCLIFVGSIISLLKENNFKKIIKLTCMSVIYHNPVIPAITSLSKIFSPKYLRFNLYTNSFRYNCKYFRLILW